MECFTCVRNSTMCGVCLMLSRKLSSVPVTKDKVHDTKVYFWHFISSGGRKILGFFEAKTHNKYIYLIMEGQEG